jgi:hypothetical protein
VKVSRLGGNRFKDDAPCMLLGHWTSTTPPHQLRSNSLHAPPPFNACTAAPRIAPRRPPPPATAPRGTALAHSTQHHPMHSRRPQAIARSTAAQPSTQRTSEVQRRQLRHPSETRCQRHCPSCSDIIDCTHRRPSARPSANPTTSYSVACNCPSPPHATSSNASPAFATTRSQRSWPPMHAAYF